MSDVGAKKQQPHLQIEYAALADGINFLIFKLNIFKPGT